MRERAASWILCGAVAASLAGCGDETQATTCADANLVWGACAGVPGADVCGSDTCTTGVTCAKVVPAGSDAELTAATVDASTGTCIALAPGQYGAVDLPGGVSLLGRSAAAVTVHGVTLAPGAGAVLRGLTVGPGGVAVHGATGARLESVRVSGSAGDGVALDAGSSITIVTSEIAGSGRAGVFAVDTDVTIDRSIVSGAAGTGLWIEGSHCDAGCACATRPALTVTSSAIRDNFVLGISARGAAATLSCVDVTGTQSGATVLAAQYGGGVSASACSDVSAKQLRVLDNQDFGVLVDGSTAALGGVNVGETVEISRNLRGLWVQNVACGGSACFTLHQGQLDENLGVGIGVGGSSHGIILCKTGISGTKNVTLPVFDENNSGTSSTVGDGLNWLDGSEVTIEALTLSGSARHSLLIDGPTGGMGGSILSVTLTGGDEAQSKPLLQQRFMPGDQQPMLGVLPAGVSLATDLMRTLAVPQPLAAVAALP